MISNYISELRWRGMLHDSTPSAEQYLMDGCRSAYLGIDPTADSLHIGHLAGIMMLRHLQRCGHKPIVVLGGATGMIGDPSGKSAERNLLSEEALRHNQACIGRQLERFLNFNATSPTAAALLNNYDWTKDYTFLAFARDIGKHLTVNYMMSKDSVQRRISGENGADGLSFTEFTYQLLQAYDFLHLYQSRDCRIQLGGSDQWGNITTGIELIRRKAGGVGYAVTCPLITKPDGSKFGKTEQGNVWLDGRRTSPYRFYQFWLNTADDEALRYIRIFTEYSREEVAALEAQQAACAAERPLQRALSMRLTSMAHGEDACRKAMDASQVLFGAAPAAALAALDQQTFDDVMDGVPCFEAAAQVLPCRLIDLLCVHTQVFTSKGECRKLAAGGGLLLNKCKHADTDALVDAGMLIAGRYLLVQRGRKNFYLIVVR